MVCCSHCQGAERIFNDSSAKKELAEYRKKGPRKSTRYLLDALREAGVHAMSLLDIGGGVGVIQHELVSSGVGQVVGVDASSSYTHIVSNEADARGYAERANHIHGDFVQLAGQINAADIVTLDRVVCCYPDAEALVTLSSQHAKRYYALVYPRDFMFLGFAARIVNLLFFRLRGNPFQIFIHPTKMIDGLIREQGLTQIFRRTSGFWQVVVYERK